MENDIDAIYEVEIKFHVQILQREDMLITYFKDMPNGSGVRYLNADSNILNIPDKIWHCKATGSLAEGRAAGQQEAEWRSDGEGKTCKWSGKILLAKRKKKK